MTKSIATQPRRGSVILSTFNKWTDNYFVCTNRTEYDKKINQIFFRLCSVCVMYRKEKNGVCKRIIVLKTMNSINADTSNKKQTNNKASRNECTMSNKCRPRLLLLCSSLMIIWISCSRHTWLVWVCHNRVRVCDIDAPTVFADVANARWSIERASEWTLYLCHMWTYAIYVYCISIAERASYSCDSNNK